jgi:hypothetical protein
MDASFFESVQDIAICAAPPDRQVPVRRRLARGGPRQPGGEARPHLPGQPPDLEDQLPHDPGRLHLAGLDSGVPGALRLLRALPVLRRLPYHAVQPHPLIRGPARAGGRGERAACLVRRPSRRAGTTSGPRQSSNLPCHVCLKEAGGTLIHRSAAGNGNLNVPNLTF